MLLTEGGSPPTNRRLGKRFPTKNVLSSCRSKKSSVNMHSRTASDERNKFPTKISPRDHQNAIKSNNYTTLMQFHEIPTNKYDKCLQNIPFYSEVA